MALPLLIKLYWVGKLLKYPFAALVGTVREYRGRDIERLPGAESGAAHGHAPAAGHRMHFRIRERTFFHSPWRAFRDRRFWIRGVTNMAEMLLHIAALFAWLRNVFCRRTRRTFIVWHPHRNHEHHLFEEVEYARWPRVLRRSFWWFIEGFTVRYGPPRDTLTAGPHGRHRYWRQVNFDQTDIAVYVGPRTWRRPIVERKSRDRRQILRLHSLGPGRLLATRIAASGVVLQSISLGPADEWSPRPKRKRK